MMRLLWLKNFYLRKLYNSNEIQLGRNQIFLPEISLLLYYLKNEEVIQLFYLSPETFLSFNTLSILDRTPIQRILPEGSSTLRLV